MLKRKSKKERRKRGECVPTSVKTIRAENSFWDQCDSIAKLEETTRNELIVRVLSEYFKNR